MLTRVQVQLDGIDLHQLDENVYIIDVKEEAPTPLIRTGNTTKPYGAHVIDVRRDMLKVSVVCEVHEYDVTRRAEIMMKLAAWAKGRMLTVNYRPGQRLRVVCEAEPSVGSALQWTERITMRFAAYELPFWEAVLPVQRTVSGASGEVDMAVPGTAENVLLACSFRAQAAVDTVEVATPKSRMKLTGLTMASGEMLHIRYSEKGWQELQIESASGALRSVLHCRTADSDDDLLIAPQKTQKISYTASGAVNATFSARGLYA